MAVRLCAATVGVLSVVGIAAGPASAWQDTSTLSTPYGTLSSDVWYDGGTTNGGARKWNYQVTAKVGGTQTVEQIKATWKGGASMRNSASFSVTAGADSVGVGASSSWQYVSQTKYWSNTNGARTSSYRSNMVAMPEMDYRFGTVSLSNTAFVKFRGDARNWQITAAA